jgi:hypothetical protein
MFLIVLHDPRKGQMLRQPVFPQPFFFCLFPNIAGL